MRRDRATRRDYVCWCNLYNDLILHAISSHKLCISIQSRKHNNNKMFQIQVHSTAESQLKAQNIPSLFGTATGGGRDPAELPGLSLDLGGGGAGLPLTPLGPTGPASGVSGLVGNALLGVAGDLGR